MPSVAVSAAWPICTFTGVAVFTVAVPPSFAVTVTCVAPAPSLTVAGLAVRMNGLVSGFSTIDTVVPTTVALGMLPYTEIVSVPSNTSSPFVCSTNVPVPLAAFAGMVIEKSATVA